MKKLLLGVLACTALALGAAPAAAQQDAEVTIVHGVPGTPVDVAVGGDVVIADFQPGTVQLVSILPGQQLADLEVRVGGTTDVVVGPTDLRIPDGTSSSIVVHLDASGTPTITVFENNTAPLGVGTGRLTIRHAAAAPAVDLVAGEARPVQDLENGGSVDLDLIAGRMEGVQVAETGAEPFAEVPPIMLDESENLIVYAVGSLDDGTFGFYTEERSLEMGASGDASGGDPVDLGAAGDDAGDDAVVEGGGTNDPAVEGPIDMTPAPTEVNTGVPLSASSSGIRARRDHRRCADPATPGIGRRALLTRPTDRHPLR
jgi:hypothetical protein